MKRLGLVILLAATPVTPVSYDYDNQGRLVRATYVDAEITYQYDDAGNMTRRIIDTDLEVLLSDGFESE